MQFTLISRRLPLRSLALLAALPCVVSCEDGPNDSYAASSSKNNGSKSNPGYSDNNPGSLDARYPGKSRQELCDADTRKARWQAMLNEPIVPPRKYAGIDMAKDDTWIGLTLEDAEKINCQGLNAGQGSSYWGDNGEVYFEYDIRSHIVTQMILNQGYQGLMSFKSRDGKHDYQMGVGKIIKDGAPFLIHWTETGTGGVNQGVLDSTELMDAALATFLPTAPPSVNCKTEGNCLYLPDGGDGTGIMGFRPLSVYFVFPQPTSLPAAQASKPLYLYNFFTKSEPYSKAPLTIKIDAEGPFADGTKIPGKPIACKVKLGLSWGDFLSGCVKTSGNAADDTTNYNKLTGGFIHDLTNWVFSTGEFGGINGVNLNFATRSADPSFYIKDGVLPDNSDIATSFIFDVRASATVTNDLNASGALDLHSTGAVMLEFLRTAQRDIAAELPPAQRHVLGDHACLKPAGQKDAGCTGLEGALIPGPVPSIATALERPLFVGVLPNVYDLSFFKPGDPKIMFCNDPANRVGCDSEPRSLWDGTHDRVREVLGRGDIYNMPSDVRDRRFFFKHYAKALVRSIKGAGMVPPPADISTVAIDEEAFFFDVAEGGGFDKAEYTERGVMSASHPFPISIEYGTDVKVGNQRYTNFFSKLDREEYALYTVMAESKSGIPGSQNNLQLTNLAGSSVLTSAFPDAFQCAWDTAFAAVAGNCDNSASVVTRKDLNGTKAALSYYRGAWEPTPFAIGSTEITLDAEYPEIRGAQITLPNRANPYNAASQTVPYQFLMPYSPVRPDVGIAVAINGQRDRWVPTGQFDFYGVTTTMHVDYLPVKLADGKMHAKIVAIETSDFLGEVFLCKDQNTSDLLSVRMYTSGQVILDWLDTHPGSRDTCGIIVRNSPFNNYPDYISSTVNGVRVNMSKGGGFGRVVDAAIYDPALATN